METPPITNKNEFPPVKTRDYRLHRVVIRVMITLLLAELASLELAPLKTKEPLLHRRCPSCKKGKLHTIFMFNERGPPSNWKVLLKNKKLIMRN